jgi:hypothetical protein
MHIDQKDCYVFIGPSCTEEEAKAVLPDAKYCPPIQCGDIIFLLARKEKPKLLIIIDGYFESVGPVWHKEILFALDLGIPVIGSSSMGALRAAELYHCGMKGVGKIFTDFRDDVLCDDDEVTVSHFPKESDYRPISDAMVNIRATLDKALSLGVCGGDIHDLVIQYCKSIYYPRRLLDRNLKELYAIHPNLKQQLENLRKWSKENFCNQKHLDALEALSIVRDGKIPRINRIAYPSLSRTPFGYSLARIKNYITCRAPYTEVKWLSSIEKDALCVRIFRTQYRQISDISLLLNYCWNWTQKNLGLLEQNMEGVQRSRTFSDLTQNAVNESLERYVEDVYSFEELCGINSTIDFLIDWCRQDHEFNDSLNMNKKFINIQWSSHPLQQKIENDLGIDTDNISKQLSYLWSCVEIILKHEGRAYILPSNAILKKTIYSFFKDPDLKEGDIEEWMKENSINAGFEFHSFILFVRKTLDFINPHTGAYYNIEFDNSNRHWFIDVYLLSGLPKVIQLLKDNTEHLNYYVESFWDIMELNEKEYPARTSDFKDGYRDLIKLHESLKRKD